MPPRDAMARSRLLAVSSLDQVKTRAASLHLVKTRAASLHLVKKRSGRVLRSAPTGQPVAVRYTARLAEAV